MIEHRSASLEVRGRTISGLALPWGERARIGGGLVETFVRGAFSDLRPVPLRLEHGGPTIGELSPSSTHRGLEVRGEYERDLEGRNRFSIEFRAHRDTRSEDLRIVQAPTLAGVAAVQLPAYEGAAIEHRRRLGSVSGGFTMGKAVDCRCAGPGCDSAEVDPEGVTFKPDLPAFYSNFSQPLGVARTVREGNVLTVTAPIPATQYGRDLSEVDDLAEMAVMRPYIDPVTGEWEKRGKTRVFTRAPIVAWILAPTDQIGGAYQKTKVDPEDRRARIWL